MISRRYNKLRAAIYLKSGIHRDDGDDGNNANNDDNNDNSCNI